MQSHGGQATKQIVAILTVCTLVCCAGSRRYLFDSGTYSTYGALGASIYEFKEDGTVIFKVTTDMPSGGFRRLGKYCRNQDTVKIRFEPLISFSYLGDRDSSTLIHLISSTGAVLTDYPIAIFRNNQRENFTSDQQGIIAFSYVAASIDSTYWNWQFEQFALYPGNYGNFPPIHAFAEFNVTIDTEMTSNWPYATDIASLLIIGNNELYNGIDYDPESIYVANMGILTKK